MKTKLFRRNFKTEANGIAACVLSLACFTSPSGFAQEAQKDSSKKEEPKADDSELRNWIDISVGGNLVHGDKPAFQQRTGQPRDTWGGVTDFHYEMDVGKKGLFEIDGRGIFDAHNYSLTLSLKDPAKGYVRAGFEEFSSYYDLSGGYFPGNQQFIDLYQGQTGEVDRTKIFFEAGLTLENKPQVRVRYEYDSRDGDKNSTIWGNTTLTSGAGTRNIVPTINRLNEDRHIVALDISHTIGNTLAGVGGRYEFTTYDNARYMRRNPGETTGATPPDRFLTHREGVDSDMFNAHAFTETDFTDQLKFTTAYSFTRLDTDISGSRAIGGAFDASSLPSALQTFNGRQIRDHGFYDLSGGALVDQHVATISLMYRPTERFTIVPSLRIESQNQKGVTDFVDVEVASGAARIVNAEEARNTRRRDFLDVAESIEARYTGITNWVFYARAQALEGSGALSETDKILEDTAFTIIRETDSSRFTQKYSVGANWYPLKGLNFAGQYYHRIRENDHDHISDNTPVTVPPPAQGYYPAFIREQTFTTDDANIRISYRPLNNLTLVTRYDFQFSTIESRMENLPETESARSTAHIFTESISWSPIARLYALFSGSYTMDQLSSSADNLVPAILQESKNNYYTASAVVGYALTEKTDLTATYAYYLADDYNPSLATGLPFGAGLEEHTIGASVLHRFSKRLQLTARYAFMTSHDETSGGHNDFDAHILSSTLRFRF
jgi:hypothetical protein